MMRVYLLLLFPSSLFVWRRKAAATPVKSAPAKRPKPRRPIRRVSAVAPLSRDGGRRRRSSSTRRSFFPPSCCCCCLGSSSSSFFYSSAVLEASAAVVSLERRGKTRVSREGCCPRQAKASRRGRRSRRPGRRAASGGWRCREDRAGRED